MVVVAVVGRPFAIASVTEVANIGVGMYKPGDRQESFEVLRETRVRCT